MPGLNRIVSTMSSMIVRRKRNLRWDSAYASDEDTTRLSAVPTVARKALLPSDRAKAGVDSRYS
ncbi:hypothetical protein D1872_323080 [compost metagenome]